jgi:excisionase family DNA binding protein
MGMAYADIDAEMLADDRPLSLLELAQLHGCSKMIVKRAIWKGKIPHFKVGSLYRAPHHVAHSREVEAVLRASAEYGQQLSYQAVYFIGAKEGPIKIGRALFPEQRLKEIQLGYPYELTILATTPGAAGVERAYHLRFAEHRLNGEWFTRCPEIEAEIARLGGGA